MFKRFLISGTKKNDVLTGTDSLDVLLGKKGNDVLDGGAGSDYLFGGKGDDTFNFNWSENVGAKDYYHGGKGLDTLKLMLTTGELRLAQQEIDEFEAFLANGGNAFHFDSFGLTVRNFEALVVNEVNTAPTANDDSAATDEDTLLVIPALDLLNNDTDPDRLDVLTVTSADRLSTKGAEIMVGADGSISYDPRAAAQLQQLASGQTVTDTFSYTITDLKGATSTATVNVTVTGVDDAPEGPADLLVLVMGGIESASAAAALNDSEAFPFIKATGLATPSFSTLQEWTDFFDAYNVVVIGEDGQPGVELEKPFIFEALNTYIQNGRGVITTGQFASLGWNDAVNADNITPVKLPGDLSVAHLPPGSDITLTPLDSDGKKIAGEILGYKTLQFHEVATDKDGSAEVLATDEHGHIAVAYDEVGAGRTVYLGSLHTFYGSAITGDADQLFERAVAWAGGADDALL